MKKHNWMQIPHERCWACDEDGKCKRSKYLQCDGCGWNQQDLVGENIQTMETLYSKFSITPDDIEKWLDEDDCEYRQRLNNLKAFW